MKKLVLKELREQLPLAVLGLLVFSVLLAIVFSWSREAARQTAVSSGYGNGNDLQPLLATSTLTAAGFFCAMFGAFLGFRQIYAEHHPDLWSFLLHRPVEPTTILRCKVVSGLLLYGLGVGPPLLGLIFAASSRGWVAAPFEWAMALPLAAIGLAGLVFYGGGLLTGLRKARWYASRGCGLGLPLLAILGAINLPEFWQALLLIAAAAVIVALAVWGSFRTGGVYRGQPALGKIGLALSACASSILVIGLLAAATASLVLNQTRLSYSYYQLTTEGEVVRISHRASADIEIADLKGQVVLDPQTGRKAELKSLQRRFAPGIATTVSVPDPSSAGSPQSSYASAQRFFRPWRVQDKALWYLMSDGRLVAFQGITRWPMGELRPPTTAGAAATTGGFVVPMNYRYGNFQPYEMAEVLASARSAFLIDLSQRELRPLFNADENDPILGFAQLAQPLNPPASNNVLIATRRSIQLLGFDGKVKFKLPYDPPPTEFPTISVYPLTPSGGYAVRFEPDYRVNYRAGGRLLTHVAWLHADGSIRQTSDLPKLPEATRDRDIENGLMAVVPPILSVYLSGQTQESNPREVAMIRMITAVVFGLLGFWQCRRHRFSLAPTIGWTLFHLLFGLAGFLAFLAVQEWPSREPCPGCRRLRAVNRERCEHCEAPFSPPPRTGVEIFEPLVTR